jgi:hypothetical protein
MSENTKKTQISIDGKDFVLEDMTQEQQLMVNHISDLDRKISSAQFSLDQLNVGKNAFVQMLKQSLETKPESTPAPTQQ